MASLFCNNGFVTLKLVTNCRGLMWKDGVGAREGGREEVEREVTDGGGEGGD